MTIADKRFGLFLVLAAVTTMHAAHAQCLDWSSGFETPGLENQSFCSAVYDDGSGPALYFGGQFQTAGPVVVKGLARWNGVQWSGLPSQLDGTYPTLRSLVVHDDGGVANAGNMYLLLGSLSGTSSGFGAGSVVLPLNFDAYLQYTLVAPNHPPLSQSLGILDPQGKATAAITLAPGVSASLGGINAHHAYVAIDPSQLAIVYASNAVSLTLQP